MANLTADVIHETRPRSGRDSYVIEDETQLFRGSLVGIDAGGYLDKWANTAGHQFQGILLDGDMRASGTIIEGETSDTLPPEGRVNTEGLTLLSATVGSVAVTDNNALVYCTTDNPADLSLTATGIVAAIGWVKRFVSSGVADVTLFTPEESMSSHTTLGSIVALTDSGGGTGR